MIYKDIFLDMPADKAVFSHSHSMDIIRGQSSDKNIVWLDTLGKLPWSQLKNSYPERFEDAGKISSLVSMDYQVCNGGIAQYFYNGYHEEHAPFNDNDVKRYDISVQKEFFSQCVQFAEAVYSQRTEENSALAAACASFQTLSYEEDVPYEETIESGEDKYIFDDDLGEEIPNPDWFEPYEETSYENVIYGDSNFDDIFYAANDYLEEILELQAQLCCKTLAQDIGKNISAQTELAATLETILPPQAFRKPSLFDQIHSAGRKASAPSAEQSHALAPEDVTR